MSFNDPMPTILAILDPANRAEAHHAAYPDVSYDRDGAALGINWETVVADMEMGL